jgi:hypothetical protein
MTRQLCRPAAPASQESGRTKAHSTVPDRTSREDRKRTRTATPTVSRRPDTDTVLHEIDTALRALLRTALPEGTAVRFDTPDRDGATPAVNLFLHDVREDLTARAADWAEQRNAAGRLVGRQPPARRYHVHYLVTGWSTDPEAEHALLGIALATLALHDTVPEDHLVGSLREAELAVGLAVAHPDLPATPLEMWTALGIPPRAALDLVVTASLLPALVTDLAEAAARLDLGLAGQLPPPAEPDPSTVRPDRWPAHTTRS